MSQSVRTLQSLCGLLLLAAAPVFAGDPGYYLVTPYSQPGQTALDVRYWSVKFPQSTATLWPEVGLRYGVNSRWTSEIYASFEGEGRHQYLNSLNWQNEVLLTQGEYPFDLGLHLQALHSPADGNSFQWGLVLQTDLGHTQLNFNLIFEHDVSDDRTQLKYQWQALHRLAPGWRLGVQGFGELGNWDHWSNRQSHRAGPTLRVGLGDAQLQAAYLWGKVYGSKADMFTMNLVWGF